MMRRPGFTLVELMVVIVIIGILTAMIVPQFAGTYQDALLRAAGRQLLEAVDLAYSQAVTQGRPVRLRFDPVRGRYWLEARAEESPDFQPLLNVPGCAGDVDARVTLELREPRNSAPAEAAPERSPAGKADLESIAFRPDGTADSREILLRGQEGSLLAVRIDPNTSRPRLIDVERIQP